MGWNHQPDIHNLWSRTICKEEVGIPPPTSHQGRIGRGLAEPAHVDLEAHFLEHVWWVSDCLESAGERFGQKMYSTMIIRINNGFGQRLFFDEIFMNKKDLPAKQLVSVCTISLEPNQWEARSPKEIDK